jgi:uncharacterized protein
MNLLLLPDSLVVCQLAADAAWPEWVLRAQGFVSISRTADELSIVCAAGAVPPSVRQQDGWRALQAEGPLDLNLTGILASLLDPLAGAKVSIFSISTFNTDYILVPAAQLETAVQALAAAGHTVRTV